ncbi:hypothetical protein FRC17_001076 [Serendipita sp. 399]|nr:hypothetical protein FRC17_001076 [Serendipita sp. 399]
MWSRHWGDHQVVLDISASEDDPVEISSLCVPVDAGPLADYTAEATHPGVLMNENDTMVTYSDVGWRHEHDPFFVGKTFAVTSTPGAWVQLAFIGTGIWVYGGIPVEGTVFSLEVVKKYGREVTRSISIHNVTRSGLDIPLYQAPLLRETDLPYANAYIYKLTLISGTFLIDFFGVNGKAVSADIGDIHTYDQEVVTRSSPIPTPMIVVVSAVSAESYLYSSGESRYSSSAENIVSDGGLL